MTDIQFGNAFHRRDWRHIAKVQTMPGVHTQPQARRHADPRAQTPNFNRQLFG